MDSLAFRPPPHLSNDTRGITSKKILQGSGFKRKYNGKNLIPRNNYEKVLETVFDNLASTVGTSSQSSNSDHKVKENYKKQKIPLLKKHLTLPSNNKTNNKILTQTIEETKNENELFCVVCNVNFISLESSKEHKDKNEFICRVCTQEFKNHDELEDHFFTHNKIRCQTCKEEFFTMKELILHKSKMHTTKKFECIKCLKHFSTRYGLNKHSKLTHDGGEDGCVCVVCGKVFKCSFQLKQHLLQSHIVYEHIECKYCHLMYLGPYKLQAHIKKIHLDSEENVAVSCSTCGRIFSRASLLSKHKETHDNIESVCEICGKLIKTKSLMASHMEMQHSKFGSFMCRICNEQFSFKKLLRMHQRKHHRIQAKSNSVFCEICGKKYKNSRILGMHKVTHSDERPFKCDVCGATFKLPVTLRTHRRVHSAVGKYTCPSCGISFKWKQTYDKHLMKCVKSNEAVSETS